jgi:hypothetical protein
MNAWKTAMHNKTAMHDSHPNEGMEDSHLTQVMTCCQSQDGGRVFRSMLLEEVNGPCRQQVTGCIILEICIFVDGAHVLQRQAPVNALL